MARRPLGGSNVQPERSLCGWQQFEAGEVEDCSGETYAAMVLSGGRL
jgi:hypothetical protein